MKKQILSIDMSSKAQQCSEGCRGHAVGNLGYRNPAFNRIMNLQKTVGNRAVWPYLNPRLSGQNSE